MNTNKNFWNQKARKLKHTGWSDCSIYAFDQPIRINILRWINGDEHKDALLDYGCGTGDFTKKLANKYMRCDLFDISNEVIEIAKKNLSYNEKLHFMSDFKELEIRGGYDTIISITVFQHIMNDEELKNTLNLLYSKLKDNGRIIVLESFFDIDDPHAEHQRIWTLQTFLKVMNSAGFELEKGYDFYYPPKDERYLRFYHRIDVRLLRKLNRVLDIDVSNYLDRTAKKYNGDYLSFLSEFKEKNGSISKFMTFQKQRH